jgi:hypothetical protein
VLFQALLQKLRLRALAAARFAHEYDYLVFLLHAPIIPAKRKTAREARAA